MSMRHCLQRCVTPLVKWCDLSEFAVSFACCSGMPSALQDASPSAGALAFFRHQAALARARLDADNPAKPLIAAQSKRANLEAPNRAVSHNLLSLCSYLNRAHARTRSGSRNSS